MNPTKNINSDSHQPKTNKELMNVNHIYSYSNNHSFKSFNDVQLVQNISNQ